MPIEFQLISALVLAVSLMTVCAMMLGLTMVASDRRIDWKFVTFAHYVNLLSFLTLPCFAIGFLIFNGQYLFVAMWANALFSLGSGLLVSYPRIGGELLTLLGNHPGAY